MHHQIEILELVFIVLLILGFLDGGINNFDFRVLIEPLCRYFTLC